MKKPGILINVVLAACTFGLLLALFPVAKTAAACEPLPATSQAKYQVNIPADGVYVLWLRALTSGDRDSVYVQIDEQCPIVAGDLPGNDGFSWIDHHGGDRSKTITFDLVAGIHTVIIAEREAGVGLDRGLFAADASCTPIDAGDNCLTGTPAENSGGELSKPNEKNANGLTDSNRRLSLVLALAGVVAALVFLAWKYIQFIRSVSAHRAGGQSMIVVGIMPEDASFKTKLRHFFEHQKVLILISIGVMMIGLIVVSIVTAASSQAVFEAESGVLSGNAKVAIDPAASGGSYVRLGELPTGEGNEPGGGSSGGSGSSGSGGSGGGAGGGSGGGSSGGGAGGGTPAGECPAFPSFPDENCTGWQHTGVTLRDCTDQTDGGYIWDSNKSFDSCYFPTGLTVYGANITITRSKVKKTIATHWSHNFDFRNLTLIDVEIEDEGNSDAFLAAVGGHNFSCLRCNVHHTGTGIHIGNNAVIRDSYTHDFNYTEGAHGAGIGAGQGNGNNAQVIHNNIQCNRLPGQTQICSSALSLYDEPTIDNVLIQNNLFNTTGGYCVYGGGSNGTNIRFIDNRFGKKFNSNCAVYGPVAVFYAGNTGNVWSGNKWQDGSGDVPPSSNL